jgi:hypothetical protein
VRTVDVQLRIKRVIDTDGSEVPTDLEVEITVPGDLSADRVADGPKDGGQLVAFLVASRGGQRGGASRSVAP